MKNKVNRGAPASVNRISNNVSRNMTRLILLSLTILCAFSSPASANCPVEPACEMILHKANLTPGSDCFNFEVISGIGSCHEAPMAMITNGCESPMAVNHMNEPDCDATYCPFKELQVEPGETLILTLEDPQALTWSVSPVSQNWDVEVIQDEAVYQFELSYSFREVGVVETPSTTNIYGCQQAGGENAALLMMLLSMALLVDRRRLKRVRPNKRR